jgi:hypothetical protein
MNYLRFITVMLFVFTSQMVFSQGVEKTSVLILGTPHLRIVTDGDVDKSLIPLNRRVLNYKPDAVCLEALSPATIDNLLNDVNPNAKNILDYFAAANIKAGKKMQARLNLNSFKSRSIADSLINHNCVINENIRKLLIDNLIAGYDYYSAMLQLMYLDKSFIKDNQLEKDSIYSILFTGLKGSDELIKVGLNAAYNLKLNRVYGIDNHIDDYYLMDFPESFSTDIQNSSTYKEFDKAFYDNLSDELKKQVTVGDVAPVYEYYNSSEYQSKDMEKQWGIFLKNNLKSGLDRSRYSLWEQRNMAICGDIMHVVSLFPKKNILVIIGASHKQFLDKYLRNGSDIQIKNLKDIK